MAAVRVEDELAKAKALVDQAAKTERGSRERFFLMQLWLSEVRL